MELYWKGGLLGVVQSPTLDRNWDTYELISIDNIQLV